MYTSHGHQIPGTTVPLDGVAPPRARCGGVAICQQCRTEAAQAQAREGSTVNPIMRYFAFDHLPARLSSVSGEFYALAYRMEMLLPDGEEKSVALRKLLESKDAAVRAAIDLPTTD